MAYTTEANAGFRASSWLHGSTAFLGKVECVVEKIVEREPLMADANNVPISRPVDVIDARATLTFLDNAGALVETVTSANLTVNASEANGSATAGVVIGKMLPGSVTHVQRRKMGGYSIAQIFELEGALTYTPTA